MSQIVCIDRGKEIRLERQARAQADAEWCPSRFEDQLTLPNGVYVWAETPDEFGPRAFQALNVEWHGRWTTYLTDAATHWGMAPWALSEARTIMGIKELGAWECVQVVHRASFQAVLSEFLKVPDFYNRYTGLFLLRCALRLEMLSKNGDLKPFVAKRCVEIEFALDEHIQNDKRSMHKKQFPDWSPLT
jgi:hypothetical protein